MGFLQTPWVWLVLVCAAAWIALLRARRGGNVGRQEPDRDKDEARRAREAMKNKG